jgi:hypothetical protein
MARPSHFEVERAHAAIEVSRASGWPEPGGPYDNLVHAELTAMRITHLGGLPGVLLDMGYVKRRQAMAGMAPATAARNNRLHVARQIISADRLAKGELAQSAVLSTHIALPVFEVTPDLAAPQLEKVVAAAYEGWEIRAAKPVKFTDALPENTDTLILIGNPEEPDAVYWQAVDGLEPHETWSTAPEATAQAAAAYTTLADAALATYITTDMYVSMQRQLTIVV